MELAGQDVRPESLQERRKVTAANAACLDFSVAKGKHLTAYRWSSERELMKRSLVSVPAMRPEDSRRYLNR